MLSIQILVNSKFFNCHVTFFLRNNFLRAQVVCYELKGDLGPVIFSDSFENFEITRICMEIMQA